MHRGWLRTLTALQGVLLTGLIAGCNKDTGGEPRIVTISVVSGTGQSGFVGGLLTNPFIVRAADQYGDPADGVLVSWTVVSGGGVATPAEAITDADGLAATAYRLGSTLGTQTVRASMPGGSPVTFTATASAAPASQITIISGDNQTGVVRTQLPTDLTVRVTDAFGNAKEGITVFYNVILGAGDLTAPSAITDATGHAKVKWTLGPLASTQRVSAQIPGTIPVIFDAVGTAAAAAIVVVVSGSNQAAPPGALLPDSLVIRVTDQYENPVRDVTVAWTANAQSGTVSPTGGKTDAVGRLATAWTLGPTGGPKEVRATVSGLSPGVFQAAGTIIFGTVMAGGRHSCALDEGGVAYCWGFNDAGQLGIGSVSGGSGPVFANLFPNAVVGGLTFSRGSSGASHSCAVTLANLLQCWGLNIDGRIGNNASGAPVPSPAAVSGANSYKAVAAGGTHTCAITTSDRAFCWGFNDLGQIGNGSATAFFTSPQAISPLLSVRSIAAGGHHSCLVTTTGNVYCWGSNSQGQAGLGGSAGPNVPTQVTGTLYADIVAGENHTCGRRAGGDVLCWGDNEFSQLGTGDNVDRNTPTPVTGMPTGGFKEITAGQFHTCGLTNSGVAYCWGQGTKGQLGYGGSQSSSEPVPVGGGINFRSISAGALHTCGVTSGNVIWCWGDNQFGTLGDGSTIPSTLPVKVAFQP